MTDLVSRHASVIARVLDFETEIEIVSSSGSWVTAADGSKYLDFTCGIAVSNLGHQPPAVKQAVLDQLDRVWHAGGVFRYDTLVRAAERLRSVAPPGIEKFMMMNSGAEAVEGAMKMARKTSGRQGIVVFRGGFHGRTMGSVTYTTSKAKYRQGYHPLVGSVFVTSFPHPFRWGMTEEEATDRAIADLHEMFKHEITPGEVAAFLVEPLQGEGGYYPGGRRFLQELRQLADEHGILLAFDEVQTGFGRTGDWFAAHVYDVAPDILIMGKAIANGFPLSAFGASAELIDQWPPGSHGTTFGGNPISCAASLATVDTLTEVIPHVPKLSEHAFNRFGEMQARHRAIGDVRGLGLMIGVELVKDDGRTPSPERLHAMKRHASRHGLLILSCGPDQNVIRFIPPLNVTPDDLDRGLDILEAALEAVAAE